MDNDTLNIITESVEKFDASDYAVFALMIIVSVLIGIYFGCFGSKQKSTEEYLLGGKTMKVLPVAFSLIASCISGITLIGVPSEVYTTNSTYGLMMPSLIISCIFMSAFFLPVLFHLNITSIYEYLEMRFNKTTRKVASFLYTTQCLLFLPSVIYLPSLALSQVTGINLYLITTGITLVCIFYTMIGGMKAVVWTDFIQTVVTIAAYVAIVIIGTVNVGGFSHVMTTAYDDGKMDIFNFDPNPFQRNTFWTVTIGITFAWCSNISCNQFSVQRFLAVPTIRDAQKILLIFWFGIVFLTGISIYGGLLAYAAYYGCDPIKEGFVSRADQIFPYYVIDKTGYIPALPGLFVAGVFSAALSTLSTCLNTLSGVIYEDFIKRKIKSEARAHIIMKFLVVAIGVFAVIMVTFIEKMGKILSASYMITGVLGAPVFGLFIMGMMIPMTNAKGALFGSLVGTLLLGWIATGNIMSQFNHAESDVYPVNTCPNPVSGGIGDQNNSTMTSIGGDGVFFLYKLSFLLYIAVGSFVSVIVGVIVSYITGPTDLSTIDPMLISPVLRRFLPKKIVEECKRTQEEKLIDQKKGYL